jgi:hypothetical protein
MELEEVTSAKHKADVGEQEALADPAKSREAAENILRQWQGQRVVFRPDVVYDDGAILIPKHIKQLQMRGFLAKDQFRDRQPEPGQDLNCRIRNLIEREGQWLLDLELPPKKAKGKK